MSSFTEEYNISLVDHEFTRLNLFEILRDTYDIRKSMKDPGYTKTASNYIFKKVN